MVLKNLGLALLCSIIVLAVCIVVAQGVAFLLYLSTRWVHEMAPIYAMMFILFGFLVAAVYRAISRNGANKKPQPGR